MEVSEVRMPSERNPCHILLIEGVDEVHVPCEMMNGCPVKQVLAVGKCPYACSAAFQMHVPGSFLTVHEFEGKAIAYEDYKVVYTLPGGRNERECVYQHDWWYFQDDDAHVKLIQIHTLDGDGIRGRAGDVGAVIMGTQLLCKCPTCKLVHYDYAMKRYTRCSSPLLQQGAVPNYIPLTSATIEDILALRALLYNTEILKKKEVRANAYIHHKGQPCGVMIKSSKSKSRPQLSGSLKKLLVKK